ncbi:MAG: serine hydrolase domain-containing protein, partial [Hyphococcus sp.]
NLLAHTSGLGSSYAAEAHIESAGALNAIDSAGFDPDRIGGFRYSNDGYDLLAILMERVYGQPYERLMREKVFVQSCLFHASLWGLEDVADPNIVSQPLRPVPPNLSRRNYGMIGSAGLLITARDLALYQLRLMRGDVLSPQSLDLLTTPRGAMSIGQATFGAFLTETDALGPKLNARGYEAWGDNAIVNHYLDHDVIVAIVTSRGPAESTGAPPFRSELSDSIEALLANNAVHSEK